MEAGRSCSLTTAVLEEWSRLGTPKQVEYLAGYLEAERSSREASKRATLLRRCALPAPKTFDGYDWSAVSWPEGMGRDSLLALDVTVNGKSVNCATVNCPTASPPFTQLRQRRPNRPTAPSSSPSGRP